MHTASCAGVVAPHEELFGGDVGQGILFAHLQVDVSAEGIDIFGKRIDVVQIDIDRTQVLQGDARFFSPWIAGNHLLVGIGSLFQLVLVEIDQSELHSRLARKTAFGEAAHQFVERLRGSLVVI